LLSVPVVYAADVEGTIEVVDRRGRRSTEWEIALLQVVAARVAGLAHDQGYASSAVA
jgi:GAF domain-containing protein